MEPRAWDTAQCDVVLDVQQALWKNPVDELLNVPRSLKQHSTVTLACAQLSSFEMFGASYTQIVASSTWHD